MAQNQEILRVSQLQDQKFSDGNIKGLSATTQAAMKSQNIEFGKYLSLAKVKYNPLELSTRLDKNTDTQLQLAAQNNRLDAQYVTYLKTALMAYKNSLNSVYQTAESQTLKTTLQLALESVQALLNSPQFKS